MNNPEEEEQQEELLDVDDLVCKLPGMLSVHDSDDPPVDIPVDDDSNDEYDAFDEATQEMAPAADHQDNKNDEEYDNEEEEEEV